MKDIVIFDLDGTLADCTHRLRHIVPTPCVECAECRKREGLGETGIFRSSFHPSKSIDVFGIGGFSCQCNCHTKNWDAFHAELHNDTPIAAIQAVWDAFNGRARRWIVTARNESTRDATHMWLTKHGFCYDMLIMRPDEDRRDDYKLKRAWVISGRIPRDEIITVFEDRGRVVKMWREEGIPCAQVNEGDF